MTKKQLQQLILQSYDKSNNIDQSKVGQIAEILNRRELKEYVKALKNYESKNSVIITLPSLPGKEDEEKFLSLFPDKKIVYNIDPSLMLGLRIKNNDLTTEISLKDTLEDIAEYVSEE